MKVIIDSLLEKQNKTRFWLSQQTGITYPNICNLCNNKTSSIQFFVLDKICDALNCEITDVLSRKEN